MLKLEFDTYEPEHRSRDYYRNDKRKTLKRLLDKREREQGNAFTLVRRAELTARYLHWGDKRMKRRSNYYSHLKWVADDPSFSDEQKAIGLLHDIVEHGHANAEDLIYFGFPTHVAHMVALLSADDVLCFDNAEEVIQHEDARKVRIRDNKHNSLDRSDRVVRYERLIVEDRAAGLEEKALHMEGVLKDHLVSYWYKVPLNISFLEAVDKNKSVKGWLVTDFVESDLCPPELAGVERLQKYNNTYRNGLTSHLPRLAA